jgi:hypothetical protein
MFVYEAEQKPIPQPQRCEQFSSEEAKIARRRLKDLG